MLVADVCVMHEHQQWQQSHGSNCIAHRKGSWYIAVNQHWSSLPLPLPVGAIAVITVVNMPSCDCRARNERGRLRTCDRTLLTLQQLPRLTDAPGVVTESTVSSAQDADFECRAHHERGRPLLGYGTCNRRCQHIASHGKHAFIIRRASHGRGRPRTRDRALLTLQRLADVLAFDFTSNVACNRVANCCCQVQGATKAAARLADAHALPDPLAT